MEDISFKTSLQFSLSSVHSRIKLNLHFHNAGFLTNQKKEDKDYSLHSPQPSPAQQLRKPAQALPVPSLYYFSFKFLYFKYLFL